MKASHQTLAHWYLQLAQQTESGITLSEALLLSKGPEEKARLRMAEQLRLGTSIPAMLRKASGWLPVADRAFIAAASETGKLPETFYHLHERHERMHKTQIKVILALLYPLGLFHVGALLFPVIRMIQFDGESEWNALTYFTESAMLIVPVWGMITLFIALAKTENPLLPRILLCIPIIRKYSKAQTLADFSISLGNLIEVGTPIQTAWQCASNLSNDVSIQKASRHLKSIFATGQNPADTLDRFKCFPKDFNAFYKTGTKSGHLDDALKKIGKQYQKKASAYLAAAALLYPGLLLLPLAGYTAYTIFKFYSNYFNIFDQLSP